MKKFPQPIVLIVEDECLIRMLAVEAFEEAGFIVLEAGSAAEALLVHTVNDSIDLLFTDVNMPGTMNGIDLAEHLKRLGPKLRVLVTSALPILRPVDHLSATFITKPYLTAEVCRMATELLAADEPPRTYNRASGY